MAQACYHFVPVRRADLSLIRTWLGVPEVRAWWGDPDEQLALIAAQLDDDRVRMMLAAYCGRSFGFIQDYEVRACGLDHLMHLPEGTRCVDQFIGETDMLGRGHGPAFLRTRAEALLDEGVPIVVTDPDPEKHRAVRAYAKAGFCGDEIVITPEGPARIMMFRA